MTEFVGTTEMIALQQRLLLRQPMLENCPWLANCDRLLAYLEPDEETWPEVRALAEQDGFLALLVLEKDVILSEVHKGLGPSWSVDFWDAFMGDAPEVLMASSKVIASTCLPDGWHIKTSYGLNDAEIDEVQMLNQAGGVSANPAFSMRGDLRPSLTVLVRNSEGVLIATAYATMMFHPKSRLGDTVFAGIVSVAEEARGKGLGKLVNAHALTESRETMGWVQAVEFVASDNTASRGMVSACGLAHKEQRVGAIATNGNLRFTK